jgi:serine/threonine-protein kinase
LELYELVRSAIVQYATKFKSDNVLQKDMTDVLDNMSQKLKAIDATTDKTKKMKQDTEVLLNDTYKAISLAYGT